MSKTISLQKLEISGFQSFAENQQIIFNHDPYIILGQNLDEGGSNGAGKSTLVRAITYALLGAQALFLTQSELKNRYLHVPSKVYIKLLINNVPLEIQRIVGGKITAIYNGQLLDGNTNEIQAQILQVLGLSDHHLLFLTHKQQNVNSGFLYLKDVERKEFLGELFQVEKLNIIYTKNADLLKLAQNNLQSFSLELNVIQKTLDNLNEEYQKLNNELEKLRNSNDLANLQQQKVQKQQELEMLCLPSHIEKIIQTHPSVSTLQNTLAALQVKYEQAVSEFKSESIQKQRKINNLEEKIQSINQDKERLLNEQRMLDKKSQDLQQQKMKGELLQAELNQLLKTLDNLKYEKEMAVHAKCHACHQTLPQSQINNLLQRISEQESKILLKQESLQKELQNLQFDSLSAQMQELLQKRHAIDKTLQEISSDAQYQVILQEIIQLKTELNSAELSIKNLEKEKELTHQALLNSIKQVSSHIESKKKQISAEINTIEQAIMAYNTNITILEQQISSLEAKQKDYIQQKNTLLNAIQQKSEEVKLREIIAQITSKNGLLAHLFDSILATLNHKINDSLRSLPLLSKFSIEFLPHKVSKTNGDIQRVITLKLYDNYNNEISLASLSGAEKQSLSIVIDTALDELLSERLGVNIQYKILDEQLGFLDVEYKELMLDFLLKKYKNKCLLLIDHGSELNAGVAQRIIVRKQYGLSHIIIDNGVYNG